MVKQEPPEVDDIPFQYEVHTNKPENVSTKDPLDSTCLNTLDAEVIRNSSSEIKLETLGQEGWLRSEEKISAKQELLHEELDIKSEDEAIPETHLDGKHSHKLGKHMKHPSKVKPIKCNICDYSCSAKSCLKIHLRIHTGERPFKCNICDYSCKQKSYLTVHLKTHTGQKPFKCNICDYSCKQKNYLTLHLKIHTGEKPFKCSICDYSCRQKSNLQIHVQSHTGEKPFKCTVCDYSCAHSSALKRHLRIHTGEKPFKCKICEYRFTQKADLNKHFQRLHRSLNEIVE